MTYLLEFTLNFLPKTPNQLLGAHWTKRAGEAKKIHNAVYLATIKNKPAKPLIAARLELIRYSSGQMDADNLRGSFKSTVDALVKCGIIEDDSLAHIGEPVVRHVPTGPRHGHVWVRVEGMAGMAGIEPTPLD